MNSSVMHVSDKDFDALVLGAKSTVLVDFWAAWCAPCRMIAPMLDRIAAESDGKIIIAKLNIDENPIIPRRYGVMSIPTLVLFNQGAPVEGTVGAVPYEPLNEWVQSWLDQFATAPTAD
jgi:thioredoxin 1